MNNFSGYCDGRITGKVFLDVPNIESPVFSRSQSAHSLIAESIDRDGYAVIDFSESQASRMHEEIEQELQCERRNVGLVRDAWKYNDGVMAIACDPLILSILSDLYGSPTFPYHTCNFHRGSEIYLHCDALHADSLPRGFRATVLVALEDMDAANGPVIVYPGSHKWPLPSMADIGARAMDKKHQRENEVLYARFWKGRIAAEGVAPVELHLRKGQAVIWTANLLHGGAPILDKSRTRWSQVTHYYIEGAQYFRPIRSDVNRNRICYKKPVNILTEKSIKLRGAVNASRTIRPGWRQHIREWAGW